jgi:pyruvate formate-lyase activating enzyme-like uncharacterized protein
MKKLTPYVLSVCLLGLVSACTLLRGDEVSPRGEETKEFAVSDFDEVDGGSAIFYTVKKGSTFKVTAIGDGRDIDDLDIRVRGNQLKVDYVNRLGRIKRYRTDIIVEMPIVNYVEFSGASDAVLEDFSGLNQLEAKLSGASKLRLREEVGKLTADVNGASTLSISNTLEILDANVSGASIVNAFEADALKAYVRASGASTVRVSVSDYLEVDASGASSVFYRGTPDIKEKTSEAGRVKKD